MSYNMPDIINAGFEFGAGFAVLHHCFTLYEHKQARGVSPLAVLFFTLWGVWNLFYYPHLGQFWSFAGGIFITLANTAYVCMLWVYDDRRPVQIEVHQLIRQDERAAIRWAMGRFAIGVVAVVTCVMVMVGCGGSGGGQGDKPVGDGSNITKGDNRG